PPPGPIVSVFHTDCHARSRASCRLSTLPMTLPYYPTVPQPSVGWYRNARQGDVTPVTPIATLVAKESTPRRRSHISSLRAVDHPPSPSIRGVTNGCDFIDTFFLLIQLEV